MKKFVVLGMGLCMALAFTSCKSSESAYKKAYEKAKQQELAEAPVAEEAPAAAPVQSAAPAGGEKITSPMPGNILSVNVSNGDTVQQGQLIGKMGTTGSSTGCLTFSTVETCENSANCFCCWPKRIWKFSSVKATP